MKLERRGNDINGEAKLFPGHKSGSRQVAARLRPSTWISILVFYNPSALPAFTTLPTSPTTGVKGRGLPPILPISSKLSQ